MRTTLTLALLATSLFLIPAAPVAAQSADTAYFQGVMLPTNETPPITTLQAAGLGTVVIHAVRDTTGKITSGSVDFIIDYQFTAPATITGLHIHKGAAGVSGGIVIPTDISSSNNIVVDATGRGHIEKQAQVSDASGVDALNGIFQDPSQFYINLHTSDFPSGAFRAQLARADVVQLMGLMNPANETPPIPDLNASAVSLVTEIALRDGGGNVTSAHMIFDIAYNFPTPVTFTGFHIHDGGAGVQGPVRLNTGIGSGAASVPSDPSGVGTLHFVFPVSLLDAQVVRDSATDLFSNPGAHYINLHTSVNGGGAVRGQLRAVDTIVYNVNMLTSNEVPPITLAASAPARVVVNTLRGDDGTPIAGAVTFDVNHRFPANTTFTGLHIHDGGAGVVGPVRINTGVSNGAPVISTTGSGNIFRTVLVNTPAALATLNTLVSTPEGTYINLHTMDFGSGAVRAQLGAPAAGPPAVSTVISAVSDPTMKTLAPGALISIYGNNLARLTDDMRGFAGRQVPTLYDGVQVTIAGKAAPLIFLMPGLINAQVPFETPAGSQTLVVTTAGTPSAAFPVTVAAVAPAIFFDATGGIVVKVPDFSLVRTDNRARPNDILLIYCTGLGQTTPPLTTGKLVDYPPPSMTAPVTVTVGTTDITPIYALASPNFIGLYQVAFRMPSTVSNDQKLKISVNGVSSNTVTLP